MGRERMEIEWRWVVGRVGFGVGQEGLWLKGVGGWVGRDVTEVVKGWG
jgi:hypothetical protein